VPRRRADGPSQLWSWDITYLPTSVRGVWLYLYLVVDVWSRTIVAWDVQDREDATLEVRLEELGVLRSFSRPRVSNDNPYSEALFRTAKYRPDYPSRPFAGKEEACQYAAAFVEWYVHEHRHSAIRFVTPQQRHSGQAAAICHQRTLVNEQAHQRHPRRWSRSVRCWQQPAVVWINEPPDDTTAEEELLFLQAA
jgi:transposase InsO family protein